MQEMPCHEVSARTIQQIVFILFAVVVLLAFGVGLENQTRKRFHGLGDRIVILFGGRTTRAYAGFGEGRGIGLWAKAATYLLQDSGEDTYQANRSLGLPDDSRDFSDAAALIRHFRGEGPFRLLTNNPKKIGDLHAAGLTGITAVKHVFGVTAANKGYLAAKQGWGHKIDDEDIGKT